MKLKHANMQIPSWKLTRACEPLPPKTTSTTCKYNDKNATINVIYLKNYVLLLLMEKSDKKTSMPRIKQQCTVNNSYFLVTVPQTIQYLDMFIC